MTFADAFSSGSAVETYLDLWRRASCALLGQVTGVTFSCSILPPEESATLLRNEREAGAWLRLACREALHGEGFLFVPQPDLVCLRRVLSVATTDELATGTHEPAQTLRQFAELVSRSVASGLTEAYGGEVRFEWRGDAPPAWQPGAEAVVRFSAAGYPALHLGIGLSRELIEAAEKNARAAGKTGPQPIAQARGRAESDQPGGNLMLLLDVELDASLHFGSREILLRDILDLTPGAVVELNQHIEEPVDLLVGGKVIARGEVVVVEGNYGLRITEIASPQERMEAVGR